MKKASARRLIITAAIGKRSEREEEEHVRKRRRLDYGSHTNIAAAGTRPALRLILVKGSCIQITSAASIQKS